MEITDGIEFDLPFIS